MKYKVYELINTMGTIEYVGVTTNIKRRLKYHTMRRVDGYRFAGKFEGRHDLTILEVASFETRKEAMLLEGELKLSYGMEWTERKPKLHQRKLAEEQVLEIRTKQFNGQSMRSLAKEYDVSYRALWNLINKESNYKK